MGKVDKIRAGLLCVSLLLILAVVGIAFREKRKQIVIITDKPQDTSNKAGVELKNVSYSTIDKDNFKQWDLVADSARYFTEKNKVLLKNVEVNLYRLDGKKYRLSGENGEFDTKTRNIKMNGRIKGLLPDRTEIQTVSIYYDHAKRLITTADRVIIKRADFTMEGTGVVIDLNSEKLKLLSEVKAMGNR